MYDFTPRGEALLREPGEFSRRKNDRLHLWGDRLA